jgi:reverse transcriptase-like protein
MIKIKEKSINWSLNYLLKESDSDLFPIPFEFQILKKDKNSLSKYLAKFQLTDYLWNRPRAFLIPKDELSFRNICQLDPIDSIYYTAIVKEISSMIEKGRVPNTDQKVFSHRVNSKKKNELYEKGDSWQNFWRTSEERAKKYKFILITDLVDFYNQIYHHAIENSLAECGIDKSYIKALINLFKKNSNEVSRGIPVGPHASHLIAEASLISLDEYLIQSGYDFCRYVDDIHVFCESYDDALIAVSALANYLDHHQKLILNRHKTRIVPSDQFLEISSNALSDNPINEIEEKLLSIINSKQKDPYEIIEFEDLSGKELGEFSKENVETVFKGYIESDSPDYPGLRWFLRKLAQVGIPEGIEYIILNIRKFYPVIREVGLYLNSSQKKYSGELAGLGGRLIETLNNQLVKKNEYLQIIILNLFFNIKKLNHTSSLFRNYESFGSNAQRKIILIAADTDQAAWLKSLKQKYSTMNIWLKRAFIYACKVLPEDERRHYLKSVKKDSIDELQKQIINEIM